MLMPRHLDRNGCLTQIASMLFGCSLDKVVEVVSLLGLGSRPCSVKTCHSLAQTRMELNDFRKSSARRKFEDR